MSYAYCQDGDHFPEELIAKMPSMELGVVQDNEGHSLGRWEDGVVGVPPDVEEEAEMDESPVCAEHLCEVSWEHTDTPPPQTAREIAEYRADREEHDPDSIYFRR